MSDPICIVSFVRDAPVIDATSGAVRATRRFPNGVSRIVSETDDTERPAISLLHVEDDAAFADLTADHLDRIAPEIDHVAVETVASARDRYAALSPDAVVCDHDLPDGTGIAFLEHVRTVDPERPFVLFTGKGSEEVASEAISAGVTDYLQKGGHRDQYEVLANRLRNAVDRYRLTKQVGRAVAALEASSEPIGILDDDGTYLFANEAYASVYGLASEELVGTHWRRLYPDREIERFSEEVLPRLAAEGHWRGDATGRRVDDGRRVRERLVLTHTTAGGHVCIVRDATLLDDADDAGG